MSSEESKSERDHDISALLRIRDTNRARVSDFINYLCNQFGLEESNGGISTDKHEGEVNDSEKNMYDPLVTDPGNGASSKKIELDFDMVLDEVETVRKAMNRSQATRVEKAESEEISFSSCLAEETYSFIELTPYSSAALLAWTIFFVQITTYCLSLGEALPPSVSLFGSPSGDDLKPSTPMNIPRGNDIKVQMAQAIAIFIIPLVTESLWDAITHFFDGYTVNLQKASIKYTWWLVANLLRLTEGLMGTVVLIVVIARSENVVDLLKDFTAMTFISTLDELTFQLGLKKFAGTNLKATCDRVVDFRVPSATSESSTCLPSKYSKCIEYCREKFNVENIILITMMCILYTVWFANVVIPQRSQTYLCQSIYVQFSDDINYQMAYFSGFYDLQLGENRRSGVTYMERRSLDQKRDQPMVLRFCTISSTWVLALSNDSDRDKECTEDSILLQTEYTSDSQHYNIMDVSTEDWSALNIDTRMMPMVNFVLECRDANNIEEYEKDVISCGQIETETNPPFTPFVSRKNWAKDYEVVEDTLVYDHSVYMNSTSDVNDTDLVFFTGNRWVITSSSNLEEVEVDEKNSERAIKDYLEKKFHPYWSDYKVDFFSEPVSIQTPKDKMSPVGLRWYNPKISANLIEQSEGGVKLVADQTEPISSIFICRYCNNRTNPCYFDNTCRASNDGNNICDCVTGSTGTLCQTNPMENGYCDEYFNTPRYGYDGGDCCISDCKSSNYKCGFDKTKKYYIGYDNCTKEAKNGYWKSKKPLLFEEKSISNMHISANGRVFGVMEDGTYSVRVYDRDGTNWVVRGSEISSDSSVKLLKISSQNDAINVEFLSPVSVAISGTSRVSVYDWDISLELWKNNFNIPFNTSHEVADMHLCNQGKSLGILKQHGSFELFERFSYFTEWTNSRINISEEDYKLFSMSDDGKKILLSSNNCLYIFSIRHGIASRVGEKECVEEVIKKVLLSTSGQSFAMIEAKEGLVGHLKLYTIMHDGTISDENRPAIRGINIHDDISKVSKSEVFVTSSQQKKVRIFTWDGQKWIIYVSDEISKKTVESADSSLITKAAAKKDVKAGFNSAIFFYTKDTKLEKLSEKKTEEVAESNFVKFHFTLRLDEDPSDLRWEIVRHNKGDKKNKIIRKGGPYDTAKITILDSIEVDKTDCIGVKIIDLGLDGLKQPAYAGVTIDAKLEWYCEGTNGYEHLFYVFGGEDCRNLIEEDNPWKKFDVSLHKQCQEVECQWEKIGENITWFPTSPFVFLHAPLSLSADGSIIAVSHHEEFSHEDKAVKVFRYNKDLEDWAQLGGSISNTATNQTGTVKSVELSADGFTVAIDFTFEKNGFYDSSVNIFKYDELSKTWNQTYDKILSGHEPDLLGQSVTLSADGSVVAIATAPNGTQCTIQLYRLEEEKFVEMGKCISSYESAAFTVQLSSFGSVVAIGFPFAEKQGMKTGQVIVFEFMETGQYWKRRGAVIEFALPSQQMGRSISISSDGSIVAVSGTIDSPIQVFEFYSETKEWQKMGNGITDSIRKDIKGYFTISLSSDGIVLAVSLLSDVQVYIYDKNFASWIKSIHKVLEVENQGDNRTQWLPIASSADVVTVAVKSVQSVEVFRLSKVEGSGCGEDERLFNFTIIPDRYPDELSWKLIERKGREIIGGELKGLIGSFQSKVLMYTKCVSISESTYYKFSLEDSFGDGICCDWIEEGFNEGIFELKWNDESVIDNTNFNFTKELVRFLPPSIPIKKFELLIINKSKSVILSWILRNSEGERLFEGYVDKNADIERVLDIPENECYTFALFNSNSNLTDDYFEISWGGKLVVNRERQKMIESIKVGECKAVSCKDGFDHFMLDFLTNESPEDISWSLKDPDDTSVWHNNLFTRPNYYYHNEACIPDNACVSLNVLNYNVSAGLVFYDVYLNGKIVESIEQKDEKKVTQLKKSCTGVRCDSGSTILRFHFQTDYFPKDFSWKLDLGNGIEGKDYDRIHVHYYYELCISVGKCMKLELNDKKGDGGTKFWLSYLNVTYQIDSTTKYKEKEIGIFCD